MITMVNGQLGFLPRCDAYPPSTHAFHPCRRPRGHAQGNGEYHESDDPVPLIWDDWETLGYALLAPAFWDGFA